MAEKICYILLGFFGGTTFTILLGISTLKNIISRIAVVGKNKNEDKD